MIISILTILFLLALWLGMLISSIGNRPQKQTAPAEVQTAYLMR